MKYLLITIGLIVYVKSFAQTDLLNMQKYWKFRNTFQERFIKIGSLEGESLPAGKLRPKDCIDNLDNDGDGYGWMHWGDGMIRQGHYLGLLATEYKLLKNSGQDLTAIRNELYYALYTIRRLDINAEENQEGFYNIDILPALNGFYNREDVGEDFATDNWGNDDIEMRCTNSAFYRNNNAAEINNGADWTVKGNSYQNVPSLDQMSSLFVGLRLVVALVGNETVQPTPNDVAWQLPQIAKETIYFMTKYAAERNWFILDVNGWPVANGGGDLTMMRVPIIKTLEKVWGSTPVFCSYPLYRRARGYAKVQLAMTGFGTDDSGPTAQQDAFNGMSIIDNDTYMDILNTTMCGNTMLSNPSKFLMWQSCGIEIPVTDLNHLWYNYIPNQFPSFYADWLDDNKFNSTFSGAISLIPFEKLNLTDYNNTIMFNMGVASGMWSNATANDWADFTGNRQLELINAVLNGLPPTENKAFYQSYLDGMSFSGPYHLIGENYTPDPPYRVQKFQSNGWASEYRWTHPNEAMGTLGEPGIYSGLDYMLYHNLYYLLFGGSGPVFEEQYTCTCNAPINVNVTTSNIYEPGAVAGLNAKLPLVPTCDKDIFKPVNNIINTTFNVGPKFSSYETLEIRPLKIQNVNTTVQAGGDVNVRSPFIICGKELTIQSGGRMDIEKKQVIVSVNAKINLTGEIRIKSGTKLVISNQGKLVMNAGSKLIIEDNAQLIIDYGGVLEYYNGADLATQGSNNEIILRGSVKAMNATTFKINHFNDVNSGRFILEGTGSGFIAEQAGTKFELYGKGKTDEFIILKDNARIWVQDTDIDFMRIDFCKVEFAAGSYIRAEQPLFSDDVTYISSNTNGGIYLTEKAIFKGCDFIHVNIDAQLAIENKGTLGLNTCNFSRTNQSLNPTVNNFINVNGKSFGVVGCTFMNPSFNAISSANMTTPANINGCTFDQNMALVSKGLMDISSTEIVVGTSTFKNLDCGIEKSTGKLTLRCNNFITNKNVNLKITNGCLLNMSIDDHAGYNTLYRTTDNKNVVLSSATINLNNGYNYFDDNCQYVFQGSLANICINVQNCKFNALNNQWNPANTQPAGNKFSVATSNGIIYSKNTATLAIKPACGFYDAPEDPGNPGGGVNGKSMTLADGMPVIQTSFNDSIRLDSAVVHAINLMELNNSLGNDLEAVEIFNDVFNSGLSKTDTIAGYWLDFSLNHMKSAIENAFATGRLTTEGNISSLDNHVAMYVNALMYMTDSIIDEYNYVPQFYHEMNKAHLFRLIGHSDIGLNILTGLESCGLDSAEQQHLNYWKTEFAKDLVIDAIGLDAIDTTIVIDTANYNLPLPLVLNEYYFGARINSLYDIAFPNCNFYTPDKILNEISKPEFAIYPNPADDIVNIVLNHTMTSGSSSTLVFQALDGKEVYRVSFTDTENTTKTVNLSGFKTGVYLYKYTTTDGKTYTGKLVVK